jgi:hypothetical protein
MTPTVSDGPPSSPSGLPTATACVADAERVARSERDRGQVVRVDVEDREVGGHVGPDDRGVTSGRRTG